MSLSIFLSILSVYRGEKSPPPNVNGMMKNLHFQLTIYLWSIQNMTQLTCLLWLSRLHLCQLIRYGTRHRAGSVHLPLSSGGNQPTLASQWESRKRSTFPIEWSAPYTLARIKPSRCVVRTNLMTGYCLMYSSRGNFKWAAREREGDSWILYGLPPDVKIDQ